MKVIFALLCLIAFIVPIAIPQATFGPLTVDAAIISLALLIPAVALGIRIKSNQPLLSLPYVMPFTLFLLAGIVATLSAYDPLQSIAMWLRYAAYFMLVFATAYAVRTWGQIRGIFALLLGAGVIASFWGFYMFIYHPEILQVGAWNLDDEISNRIAGTFPDANWFGEFLVMTIPVSLALLFTSKRWPSRIVIFAGVAVLVAAILMTYSRGSWLALAFALAIFIVLVERRLIFPMMAAGAIGAAMLPGFSDRLTSMFQTEQGTAGFRSRLWDIYIQEFLQRPIAGTGLGNYLEAFSHYNLTHPIKGMITPPFSAHSYYLGTMVEGGILGILTLALLIIVIARVGLSIHRRTEPWSQTRIINAAIMASLAGAFFNGLTSSLYTHPRVFIIMWLLVGVQAALLFLTKDDPEPEGAGKVSLVRSSYVYRWLSRLPSTPPVATQSALFKVLANSQDKTLDALERVHSGAATLRPIRRAAPGPLAPDPAE